MGCASKQAFETFTEIRTNMDIIYNGKFWEKLLMKENDHNNHDNVYVEFVYFIYLIFIYLFYTGWPAYERQNLLTVIPWFNN